MTLIAVKDFPHSEPYEITVEEYLSKISPDDLYFELATFPKDELFAYAEELGINTESLDKGIVVDLVYVERLNRGLTKTHSDS